MAKKKLQGLFRLLETISHLRGKTYLMLCELIDNSISSWLDDGKNKTVKGLNIVIEADFSKLSNDKQIIRVIDNAYGMNEDDLEKGLNIGIVVNKKSKLSVFGMGLKQASFWLGRKLEVFTKKQDQKVYYACIDLEQLKKNPDNDEATYDLTIFDAPMDRGTMIQISNINDGVEKGVNFYTKQLKTILGWKYNRYIKNGLSLNIRLHKEIESYNIQVTKFFPTRENITEWAKDEEKDIDIVKKELISKLTSELTDNDFRKKLLDQISNDKHLMFEIPLDFKSIKSKMQIGILSYKHRRGIGIYKDLGYIRVNGISIYQADRAVFCGPNEIDSGNFARTRYKSAGEIFQIRIFGSFVVDKYVDKGIITLDTNKQSLKWDDTPFKKYIETQIENFKNQGLKQAVEIIGKYQANLSQDGFGPTTNPKGLKKIEKEMANRVRGFQGIKVSVSDETIETRSGDLVHPLVISNIHIGEHINSIHVVEERGSDDMFIYSEEDGEELIIRININHSLWNPYMIKINEEIKRNIVYPLAVMIGIAQFAMNCDTFEEKDDFEQLLMSAEKLVVKDET